MKDYRSTEETFEFSPLLESAAGHALERMTHKRWDEREHTRTGPDPDGKTPFLDAFERMPDAPYVVALAQAIVDSWLVTEVVIYPDDVLVGVPRPRRALYEHFSWGIEHDGYQYGFEEIAARRDEIEGRIDAIRDRLFPLDFRYLDAEGTRIFGDTYFKLDGLWSPGGYQGHTVPDYPRLLADGIGKTLERVRKYAANTGDQKKLDLYRAMEIILRGMTDYVLQYAARAEELAAASKGEAAARYRNIAANCRAIATAAPTTYYQAAQLTWFYSLWDWVDCVGRADQYLWPFYLRSLERGDDFSCEDITSALFLKFMEHGVHNIPLGGVKPQDGTDATNDLSYMILQIARRLHSVHPRLVARIHENSPAEFMALVVKMWSQGMSDPTVVSDKLVIEGLCEYGVSLEDARDYTTLGCQEIEIPGKSNFGCEDGVFNVAKVLEYTLNDGCDRKTGVRAGARTGHITDYDTVEELWEAFLGQLRFFTRHFVTLCNKGQEIRSANVSKLVKSIFTDDCVARGLDLDSGGSIYNYGVVETAGASAVADSFAAMQKLVFDEKVISKETLEAALAADFKGYEDVKAKLLAAPKYGNDEPLPDGWMARLLDEFWGDLGTYRSVRGGVFTGACSLLEGGVSYGHMTWAMPDGRSRGEPLGNTIGPRTGADVNGPTAMLNSVAKLPLKKGVGGSTVNLLIPTDLTKTPEGRANVAAMMTAYLMNGGQMAQVTTASKEDMIDAKAHPERHGDLIVRVGGFSTRFIDLGESGQNEIINRYS